MKVLHIIDSLGLGGAQTVVKGIFEYQPDNSIFLFALRKREITTEIKHTNVKICNSDKKYSLKPLFELRDLIKEEKIDILHCHLFRSQVFGWLLKIIWFKKIKLIFHEHGGIIEDGFLDLFLELSQNSVNIFIAVSRAMENALIKNAKIDKLKIRVIYNFVDLKKFNKKNIAWNVQKEKEKIGVRKNDFVVGSAGRLIERKGWRDFIKAAALLVKKKSNVRFIIAGDGTQKDEMLQLIEKWGLEDDIIYVGYKSNMVWFYSILECFVIPSHWEPMGITEIEAQAMIVPVIASNVDGLNEIIKDEENGILFEVKNSLELAEKIKLIKGNTQLKDYITKNATNNIKKYSLEKYLNNLNKIYENK